MIVQDLVDLVWHSLVKTDFSLDVQNRVHSHQQQNWENTGRQVAVYVFVVISRLHSAHLRARRPIKRPYLSPHHRQARLQWANDHLGWNIRNWQKIHWSDESRFLLRPVDARMRVWRQINTAYNENNIFPTSAFWSGGVTVWGCFSLRCKLDLYVLNGTMNGQMYRDSVLRDIVAPHLTIIHW